MRTAVITDSNSGLKQGEYGIHVIPMPFYIDDKLYFEDVTIDQPSFFDKLQSGAKVSTSQPSIPDITFMWDKLLKTYDEIVHIPMSSGLSGTCNTIRMLAKDYQNRVFVVDNRRISVTQRQSCLDAVKMAENGKSGSEIRDALEETAALSSIYIAVDTMEYLKKGGRVTPAAAGIATILNIKPVLQIQGGRLDQYAKARGMKAARKMMIGAMRSDLEKRFFALNRKRQFAIAAAYSGVDIQVDEWLEEIRTAFPGHEVICCPLSLSVSCHIGAGSLAIAGSWCLPQK